MPRRPPPADVPVPPCYATVQPGLEPVAADELARDFAADVKKTTRGVVAFRVSEVTAKLLAARTTEDIYLLGWGSDSLTYTAADLKTIAQWTRKVKWDRLFALHHAVRGKPAKNKPTFHLVTQMQGEHGYRRVDARGALIEGLKGAIPDHYQLVDENAYLEIWLSITGKTAVCGVRLSDRTMRHRTYKTEHAAASLRPSVAAAMVRLAAAGPGDVVLDPMCGAGTILAEQIDLARRRKAGTITVVGGDIDPQAIYCATENAGRLGPIALARWDALRLPLATASVDRIISNPPFGKQMSKPEDIPPLYRSAAAEWDRVLKPGGRAVLLVAEADALREAVRPYHWQPTRQLRVRVLGQPATVSVWQKPLSSGSMS
jgi:tRNA (guanine6-N2)-methyltransferase